MSGSSIIVETAAAIKDDEINAAEPATMVAMITKERVPDSFIDRIKTHPSRKLPPLSQEETELYYEFYPEAIPAVLENITRWNYFVDLEQDCLRQHAEKGYAEVGVDFTKGVKQLFILPEPQPQVMKERVPESYITRIKARPLRKIPPLSDRLFAGNPSGRETIEGCIAQINYLVDMEQDCLRQHAEKGYAEIGVDYADGVKKVFILPQPQQTTGGDDVAAAAQGNCGGGRSKVGFAIVFALLVALLSCLLMNRVCVCVSLV